MDSGRKQDRKAVSLLVKLQHPNIDTFIEQYATNLSPGGMFIRTRQPQPVGTRVRFEVQIAGGVRVMKGYADVRWIRQPGDASGAPGMGVQFEELDPSTRALVDRMIAARAPAEADPAAALEAELRATYGDPARARTQASGSLAPIAPVIASIAPVVAPAVPPAPAPEIAIELEPSAAAPPDAVDLDLDLLIASTPEPSAELAEEAPVRPPPPEDLLSGFDILPEPVAPPPPPDALLSDLDVDAAPPAPQDEPLDLDLDIQSGPPAHPPPPAEAPRPAAAARPAPVPPVSRAPPAPPVPASSLPPVRRTAGRDEEEGPPPVLAKPAAPAPALAPRRARGPVFLQPPEKIEETGPVIGIDLGTTNSCVGILQAGKPVVMRSKQGYNTLPSVVSVTSNGKLLVAHPAKNQMLLNPNRTIYGAKRLVGRAFDSATVQQVRERFHYEVCADDAGRAAVKLGDQVLSLEEVQGLILRECREMAERELNKPISRAVVTVPAYYSEPQREAVRKAGNMAGLKVERILNEPTAAALAFGMNRELNKRVLVYDLGGGTFDATVLKIEKNVFEVLATGGDTFLGGVDFDNAIVDLLLEKFQQGEGIPFSGDSVALSRVSEVAEKAKCALSERATFDVHVPMLMADPSGKWRELRCTLSREDLTSVTGSLVERTLDVVRDVLLDAGLKTKDVDDIILVGGQSRMPLVREKLKELFGKPAQASVNADEAVALGAALYSGSVDKVSSVVLIDVLPMTIGIGMSGGAFKRVIERNTPLPAQRSFSLPTSRDNETTVEFDVFQGEDPNIAGNDYLGTVRIEGLPKAPKGLVKLAVTLRLDAECVLHAEAVDLQSRKTVHTTLATRYTPDEVQKKLGLTQEQVRKVNEKRAGDLRSRGGGFWSFLKKVVSR